MSTPNDKPATRAKKPKLSGPEQVAAFMAALEHPQKAEIEAVREIILSANPRLSEHIKWNAPSFHTEQDDRVTFNFHGKGYFQLVFHCGAKVRESAGKTPMFEDDTGLLSWVTGDRATVKFASAEEVKAAGSKLAAVVNRWIEAADA